MNSPLKVGAKMSKKDEYNITCKTMNQIEKENYIVDMLINTLYSNNVNNSECYRILKLFKERTIGNIQI